MTRQSQPLCIAHRGGPIVADETLPENSLAAIDRALALGVDGIEIDIWHIHGKLWVTHDRRLGRLLPGSGRLEQASLATLLNLQLENGEALPQLDAVLQRVGEQALLNIEIKNRSAAQVLAQTLAAYQHDTGNSLENVLISSFDHTELFTCRQLLPNIRRGVLVAHLPLDYAACTEPLAAYSLNTDITCTSAELVADSHNRGLAHWVFTANSADDWEHLSKLGVDGVFTDRPDEFMAFRRHQEH